MPKPYASIDDEERQGLGDRGVLKSVIEHDHLRSRRDCGADAVGSVARHPARRARGEQQRLVADRCGIVAGRVDPHRSAEAAAVTARHDVHRNAARDEVRGQRQRDRGLAGAARDQIADAHHRNRRAIGAGKSLPQPSRGLQPAPTGSSSSESSPGGRAQKAGAVRIRLATDGAIGAGSRTGASGSSQGASRSRHRIENAETGRRHAGSGGSALGS